MENSSVQRVSSRLGLRSQRLIFRTLVVTVMAPPHTQGQDRALRGFSKINGPSVIYTPPPARCTNAGNP